MEDMAITQFVADLVLMGILAVVLQNHKTAFRRRVFTKVILCVALTRGNTARGRTNAMINRLIIFTVSRGILTACVYYSIASEAFI